MARSQRRRERCPPALRASGRLRRRVGGPFRSDSADTVLDAAEAGLGIALVPSWQAARAISEGRLARVLPACEPPETPIHALWPPARRMSAAVRAFVDHLAKFMARHPCFRPLPPA